MDNIFSNSSKKKTTSHKMTSSSHKKSSSTHKKSSSTHKMTVSSPKKNSSTPESISIKVKSKSPQTIQEFDLKFPEPLPDKINFDERISKKMNTLFNKHQDIKPFLGDTLFVNIFYLYLFNKYKTNCFITKHQNIGPEMEIIINPDEEPNINDQTLKFFSKKLVNCILLNKPIIILPLSLQMNINGSITGHANLLIYRNNTREIEHFEPHGGKYLGDDKQVVNEILNKNLDYLVTNMNIKLNKSGSLPIKLVKAHEVCPRLKGIQSFEQKSTLPMLPIEPEGYCSAWSMFFTEMCLKNPEIPSRQIYEAVLNEIKNHDVDYLKNVIRGYTCFINNKMAKYFSEILNHEITGENLRNYHLKDLSGDIAPPEMTKILDQLDFLIQKEAFPFEEIDMERSTMHAKTLKKYNKFKKTIRKSTSSSDLSDQTKESRHHTKQLKKDYNTKLLEFIDRKTAKDKERKVTEKIRKAEEKERKATEKQRKLEEKERKATVQAEEKLRKAEEKERKAIEHLKKVTEKAEKS